MPESTYPARLPENLGLGHGHCVRLQRHAGEIDLYAIARTI
ncbi:hypothetical protein [Tahibacter caeni]|nr:hypothetical protein [Tahibacter caeni]